MKMALLRPSKIDNSAILSLFLLDESPQWAFHMIDLSHLSEQSNLKDR